MPEQSDISDAEGRLASDLRLVTNAGFRASAWPRLSGEIRTLATIVRARGMAEDLRAGVIGVLEEATRYLDPDIAKAAQCLYGWNRSWWEVSSKARREATRDLLFGAYSMSWESFRDRREQTIHISVARAILQDRPSQDESSYAPALRRNPIWIHYFQYLEPIRRAAHSVITDLALRDVHLFWDGRLTIDRERIDREGIDRASERGLAYLMLLDYWIDAYQRSNLPHLLPIVLDEQVFREVILRWPSQLIYPNLLLRDAGQKLLEECRYDRSLLTSHFRDAGGGELLERWRHTEISPYPHFVIRIDDCANALYAIITRNFYSSETSGRAIVPRIGGLNLSDHL